MKPGAFLEGAPVIAKSTMQETMALSVTEAELVVTVMCAQYMLHIMRVLIGLELQVELPMVLWVDNSRAVDLANNWICGKRTRHMDTREIYLRKLKEKKEGVTG